MFVRINGCSKPNTRRNTDFWNRFDLTNLSIDSWMTSNNSISELCSKPNKNLIKINMLMLTGSSRRAMVHFYDFYDGLFIKMNIDLRRKFCNNCFGPWIVRYLGETVQLQMVSFIIQTLFVFRA